MRKYNVHVRHGRYACCDASVAPAGHAGERCNKLDVSRMTEFHSLLAQSVEAQLSSLQTCECVRHRVSCWPERCPRIQESSVQLAAKLRSVEHTVWYLMQTRSKVPTNLLHADRVCIQRAR